VICSCELWGREEGCEWVTHKAVSGADVVAREEGCMAVLKEDLFVRVREVRR
jgi:hypothetical protein